MQTDSPYNMELLKEAFSSFSDTSERLEQVYQKLESSTSTLQAKIEKSCTLERDIRLQSMGWMVTKIAHDIRNPLGSIELISSLLRRELSSDTDKQRLINHIIYGIKNIDNVISNLLHFTHFPKPMFRVVNIDKIFSKALEVMSFIIEKKNIKVTQEILSDSRIYCDETLMKQVFLNLFFNSLQAMTSNGSLSVKVFRRAESSNLHIHVRDTGSGISPENLNRIFDPFFTTKEKGTGLGLTIVHNIIKVHEGTIEAYSKSGEGSLFTIKIPERGEKDYESISTSDR